MARTLQEQLDSVDAAIAAIEGGAQSYTTVLGQVVTRGNLAAMYARQIELQGLLAAEELSGVDGGARINIGLGSIDRAV